MTVIIDRIEDKFAVVELPGGDFAQLPLCLVPNAKEGDVVTIEIDHRQTKAREVRIQTLMDDVFGKENQ